MARTCGNVITENKSEISKLKGVENFARPMVYNVKSHMIKINRRYVKYLKKCDGLVPTYRAAVPLTFNLLG